VAIAEFVTDGRSGRLVEGHEPAALVAAIVDLAGDRTRRAAAGRHAAAEAGDLRAEASVAAHAELYASVLGGAGRSVRREAAPARGG
jgi:D-inositol-3-phosphate glycosyltransferase